MKKLVSMMMVAAAALALAGCGGTGSGPLTGGQSSQGGAPPTPTTYQMSMLANVPQLSSNNATPVTITALVRDQNNNVVSGVPVAFQASSGALTVTKGTTDTNGTATATLGTAGDPTDRDITVSGTAGATTAKVAVSVVGTKLSITGPTSLVSGHTGTYTVALVDSGGTGISGVSVAVTSAKDNTISPGTITTDSTGQASFTVTGVNGGDDTLTASAEGLQATYSVSVSNDSFSFTGPAANTNVPLGKSQAVTIVWTSSGTAQSGQIVNFAATRGQLSATQATTGVDGSATVNISSTTAGPSVISATANGVSAQLIINFISTTPNAIDLQSSPGTIPTQGQSTITATVRDANNNLVEGQTVDFTITQDSTGGTLSIGSAVTNAQGQASTVYTASSVTSATNGVVIQGSVQGTSVTGQTTLTVGGETVFLSLGTGNAINTVGNTQYSLPYTVQAIDSAGNGVKGVTVTFAVTSLGYIKGAWSWNGANYVMSSTLPAAPYPYDYVLAGFDGCATEDVNSNGILDTGEDYNGNGKLDPGLVVSTDVGQATTDASGTAAVNLIYPKDHAGYVAVRLTATATVQGTQSTTSADFWLPAAAVDLKTQGEEPGPTSPYGIATDCRTAN